MYNEGTLAYTGVGVSVFGATIGLGWVIAGGVGLIVVGALLYRFAKRRSRQAS